MITLQRRGDDSALSGLIVHPQCINSHDVGG